MFKKPRPHGLNGLAEILQQAEDSKVKRGHATRSLIVELEKRQSARLERTGDEQIAMFRKFGAI